MGGTEADGTVGRKTEGGSRRVRQRTSVDEHVIGDAAIAEMGVFRELESTGGDRHATAEFIDAG